MNTLDLETLKAADPKSADKSELFDIRDVVVREDLPPEERIADFIRQIRNPYLCRCGNIVVQSVFSDTETTLTNRLKQYFHIV